MIEVLSPAGNIEALKCAVANRTDAVYLGLEQFNARLKADNFSTQNIKEWVDFCHFYGVKVYVTINTLIKQKELAELDNILLACKNAQVDALIVTDFAVVAKAKNICPEIPLHASTQMGIHNYLGAQLLEKLGFSRVVLARECKIEDIKEIKKLTNLEIEYFVHGAMCVAFSGQCLLSSISSGNSGNRGLCLQPCRKEYTESLTGKSGYMISTKDQCLIERINELEQAGVDSIKIEGRLKSSEYVGVITAKYRAAVDGKQISNQDFSDMKRVFNRGGFCEGYAFSDKNQILCTTNQNNLGEKVGEVLDIIKCKNYFKIVVETKFNLNNGDGIKILRDGKEIGGTEVSIIEKNNDVYKLYSKYAYEKGDHVHLTFDSCLQKQFMRTEFPRIPLDLNLNILQNKITIKTSFKNNVIEYTENTNFDFAKKLATSREEIENQFCKTGGTQFDFEQINITLQDNLFIPKSSINGIRRNFVDFLYKQIVFINTKILQQNNCLPKQNSVQNFALDFDVYSPNCSDIVIADKIDFDSINKQNIMKIVLNYNSFNIKVLNYAKNHNNLFVKLPKIALKADLKMLLAFVLKLPKNIGIYADSLWQYYLAILDGRAVIGGIGLNLYNSDAVNYLRLNSFVVSPELCKTEIEDIAKQSAVFAFGYLPVMNFCHCPVQHFTGCSCNDCKFHRYSLKDKYGEFKVRRVKIANCYFEMLNSSCHFIEKEKLPNNHFALIDVTGFENVEEIVNNYINNSCYFLNNSIKLTRGQFARGVK